MKKILVFALCAFISAFMLASCSTTDEEERLDRVERAIDDSEEITEDLLEDIQDVLEEMLDGNRAYIERFGGRIEDLGEIVIKGWMLDAILDL